MSSEIRTITVTLTVRDSDHLPPGYTADDVVHLVTSQISESVNEMYETYGASLLVTAPDVS